MDDRRSVLLRLNFLEGVEILLNRYCWKASIPGYTCAAHWYEAIKELNTVDALLINQSKLYVETRDLYKARERLETKTSCVRIDFASLMGFYVKHDLKHTSCKIES